MASGSFFGGSSSSSGPSYMPSQSNMQGAEGVVYGGTAPGGMGYFSPTSKYLLDGKEIDQSKYNQLKNSMFSDRLSTSTSPSQFMQDRPQMNYNPGSSGYNVLGQQGYQRQGSMTPQGQNNIWSDKAVDTNFINRAEPYYNQIANNATNNAMLGARSAANSMASALGQRGVAQGGLGQMAGNQLANSLGRQLGDISSQVGFQRAQDYNQLAQAGATLQNQMNQFNRQQDLSEQMQNRNMGLQEMLGQYELDKGLRAEQYGYWKDPYNDYLKLFQLAMSLPSTSQSQSNQGLFNGLPGMTGFLGGMLG